MGSPRLKDGSSYLTIVGLHGDGGCGVGGATLGDLSCSEVDFSPLDAWLWVEVN